MCRKIGAFIEVQKTKSGQNRMLGGETNRQADTGTPLAGLKAEMSYRGRRTADAGNGSKLNAGVVGFELDDRKKTRVDAASDGLPEERQTSRKS